MLKVIVEVLKEIPAKKHTAYSVRLVCGHIARTQASKTKPLICGKSRARCETCRQAELINEFKYYEPLIKIST